MTTLALVVLGLIWAAVLIPPMIRARAEGRPGDSISAFHRQLAGLDRTNARSGRSGGPSSSARTGHPRAQGTSTRNRAVSSRTLERRRKVLGGLAATAGVTLLLMVLSGFNLSLVFMHLLADMALGGYVALLLRVRTVKAERDMKVRFLPYAVPLEPMVEPALLGRPANY
ncbi:MAG: hypothetical protein ACT4OS_06845 [Acidimicrobiales bacterium]